MTTFTEGDIAQGIANKEFMLYYQPKASLITNRIVGAEALARWRRPDGTVQSPASFIQVAERSGLIKDLALQLLPPLVHELADTGLGTDLCVSFNVTAQDFEDDTLTEAVLYAIAHQRLPPASLELEITETQALEAGCCVLHRIQALTNAGIGLAMDDYGIGYSSMDTLSQWPFTTIKLDQGIVGRMLDSKKNATIVRSSIRLGHELGLKVVAEGVEAMAQYDFLVDAGCGVIQGYLLSPPLPLDDFLALRRRAGDRTGFPIGLVYMAIVDHVQWRRQMVTYAIQRANLPSNSPARQTEGYPELCVTKCSLGRWYYGDGRYFAETPMYEALDGPHHDLHRAGEAIVDSIRAGATLAELAAQLQALKVASTSLIRLLEDIEDVGLQAMYGEAPGHTCASNAHRDSIIPT
ncbi:EAL domain-containing protein [Telluria aromaticivorans]|uniref:EAL domain-containing protein n=1 Tax=Telluria aromaticivorans TaxID=2725995 RepID=A0A7Y2JVR9_9BURK|nr:EAL domain-containing protein [Telluria aromaticivorans]NNG21460.1 EAL domain-containing protein [Telluria aromaticivorans]